MFLRKCGLSRRETPCFQKPASTPSRRNLRRRHDAFDSRCTPAGGFFPRNRAKLLQGLAGLWPKFPPYVLSFGVLGLRWLANIEVRTRAAYFQP
jgi:hypothetical protein